MAKTLYNLRLLGDHPMTGGAFDAFMDGFGASMDIFPVCRYPNKSRSADKIWADFVRVAQDMNESLEKVRVFASETNTHLPQETVPKKPEAPRKASAA